MNRSDPSSRRVKRSRTNRSRQRAKRVRKAQSVEEKEAMAYRAAELHFALGIHQCKIAGELNVSEATVSRLLTFARKQGLVQILLNPPFKGPVSLRLEKLLSPYQVRKVLVAQGEGRGLVGHLAARYFERQLLDRATVVLDGGWTVRDFVTALATDSRHALTLVPVAADPPSYQISAYELMMRMALKFARASCEKLPHLTNLAPSSILKAIHEGVARTAREADFVFLGLGPWDKDCTALRFVEHLGLEPDKLRHEYPDVAAVCGYFPLYKDGTLYEINDIQMRLPHALSYEEVQQLARAPDRDVVLLAASEKKCEALCAVLRARLCNVLALDEPLAEALVKCGPELLPPLRRRGEPGRLG